MDWNAVKHNAAPPQADAPSLNLIETCWRLKAPSGKLLTCGIYRRAAPGLEVRCGYEPDDLLRLQTTAEIGVAREIAEEWRQAVLAKGGFEEVPQP